MATDNFTAANGTQLQTYNGNWLTGNMLASDFVIDTNAVRTPFSRVVRLFSYFSGTWALDHSSQVTVTQVGSNLQFMGVCVRASADNAYTFVAEDSTWVLSKTVAGVITELDTGAHSLASSDVLYLEANGQTITASINGTTVTSVTDSSLVSGAPGIAGEGGAASGTYTLIDSWAGLDLPAGVSFTAGTGTVLATDEIGLAHHQRQKLTWGADGAATDADTAAPVPATLAAVTSGGPSVYKLGQASGTNSASVKASAATVYGIVASNANSSPAFLKLYDKASSPTVGTDVPTITIPVPRQARITLPQGIAFSTGLAIAVTTGVADTDTGGVTAGDVTATVFYQ